MSIKKPRQHRYTKNDIILGVKRVYAVLKRPLNSQDLRWGGQQGLCVPYSTIRTYGYTLEEVLGWAEVPHQQRQTAPPTILTAGQKRAAGAYARRFYRQQGRSPYWSEMQKWCRRQKLPAWTITQTYGTHSDFLEQYGLPLNQYEYVDSDELLVVYCQLEDEYGDLTWAFVNELSAQGKSPAAMTFIRHHGGGSSWSEVGAAAQRYRKRHLRPLTR